MTDKDRWFGAFIMGTLTMVIIVLVTVILWMFINLADYNEELCVLGLFAVGIAISTFVWYQALS